MFKKVILNTGAQIFGKAFTASITLLITIIIGRTLGPQGYGDFTKIFVFVGYFYTLSDFGLNAIYIKLSQKEDQASLFQVLIALRLILGIFLALAAVFIAFFLPYNPAQNIGFSPLVKTGILIASLTILTQSLFTTANAYFQKILRYDLSTIAASVGYTFILATAAFAALTKKGLLGYTLAYVIGGLIFVTFAYFLIQRRMGKIILPLFSSTESAKLLKLSWPIGIALIFNLIYFRIDVLILSNFRSSAEVGLYGLAYQFFETSLAIPIFFANAIYPPLSKLYQGPFAQFKKEVLSWARILSVVSILLTLALIVISFFIPLIFGAKFEGSVKSLQILALGMPFFFLSALFWHILIIYNKQKYLTFIYGSGAIFNLVANLIFIPKNGYIAASIITVISEALITLMLLIVLRGTGEDKGKEASLLRN